MLKELIKDRSIVNRFIAEVRDAQVQQDPMRFQEHGARIGEVMAYELSRTMEHDTEQVTTRLERPWWTPREEPVLATILGQGCPSSGLLNYFDRADSAFISAYRKHRKGPEGFDIEVEYLSSPRIDDRCW